MSIPNFDIVKIRDIFLMPGTIKSPDPIVELKV